MPALYGLLVALALMAHLDKPYRKPVLHAEKKAIVKIVHALKKL